MSLLSYNSLVQLVNEGVIDAPIEHVNAASIDLTLDNEIMIEKDQRNDTSGKFISQYPLIDLKEKQSLSFKKYTIPKCGIALEPGQFILATTQETFNLHNYVAAEYKLKSSLARSGLQHLLAGWCDPGWHNSKLTLELKNVTQYHNLILKPGMKIGQIVFWICPEVPDEASYAAKGQYNNQETVTAAKELK